VLAIGTLLVPESTGTISPNQTDSVKTRDCRYAASGDYDRQAIDCGGRTPQERRV